MLSRDGSSRRAYPEPGGSGRSSGSSNGVQEAGMAVAPGARLAVVAAAAATPLLLSTPAAAADYYRAQTTATAIHLRLTQQPAGSIITASLFDDAIAYAAGDFETAGGSEALAAPAFPGKLVTQGPALLCSQVFECPAKPPDYPLLADASYPRQKQDSIDAGRGPFGAGPLVLTPVAATATATPTGNDADTASGTTTLLAGTPVALSVGAGTATSRVSSTGGRLRVHVESVVTDVIVGGLLRIESVHAVDDIVVVPGQRPRTQPRVTVAGVTVGGERAVIDESGIHVAGRDGPALGRELAARGIDVHTVAADSAVTRTAARAEATALRLDLALPVDGLPYVPNPLPPPPPPFDQIPALPGVNGNGTYVAQVTLGAVGAVAGIGRDGVLDLGDVGPLPSDDPGDVTVNPSRGSGPLAGPDLVDGLANPPAGPPPAVAGPQGTVLRGLTDLLSPEALERLYLVVALGSMGLLLGWRATVTARRHGLAGRRP
jgi:hypothetical protein